MSRAAVAAGAAALSLLSMAGASQDVRERGADAYGRACAACHGSDLGGGGVPERFLGFGALVAPPLAGPCALRAFATAAELLAYVRYDMPLHAPGTLPNEDAMAIVGFLLARNGIPSGAEPLTLSRASAIDLAGAREGRQDCGR